MVTNTQRETPVMKKLISVMLSVVIVVTTITCLGLVNASAAKTGYTLSIDGFTSREIVDVSVGFENEDGSLAQANLIKIKVKALNDGNPDLFYWMAENNLAKNGKIEILNAKDGKLSRRIEFSNAYCVHYEETFEVTATGAQMFEEIWISAGNIKMNTLEYEANWN